MDNDKFTILFFSDIHTGESQAENQGLVLDEFISDCKKQLRLQSGHFFVLIAGDLVYNADKPEQYEEFDEKIIKPLVSFGIPRNHIICVPGNHDTQKSVVSSKQLSFVPLVEKKYPESQYNDMLVQEAFFNTHFSNYNEFVRNKLDCKDYNTSFHSYEINDKWSVCCLNTSLTSFASYAGRKDLGFLGIDTRSLHNWLKDNHNKKKILLMHHPQSWLMEWASESINIVIKKDFDLVLTGHTHSQDLLCNVNGVDSYVHCMAPQLFTSKEDKQLGYCIINIADDKVVDVIYRQWSEKRHRFNPGADFTPEETGIVKFVSVSAQNKTYDASNERATDDKLSILLRAKLNENMIVYNDQPIVWVDRYLSAKRVDQLSRLKMSDMFTEDDIIKNPRDIIILSPAQYGLTCYGIHFLISAWEKYGQFGIYIPNDVLKKNKLEGYIDSQLQDFSKDVTDVSWIVVDDWIVSRKDSKTFISTIKGKIPNAKIMLLSPRIERYFKENSDISVREEGFDILFMAPLKRDGVRRIVKAFNNKNYIEEEDRVLKRVDDDIKDFNMHRTPLNCITLLEVFNNSPFQDNPVNRTEVIERVLRIIFDNHRVPSYRTSVPDMKDCQFVLGFFCKQLILNDVDYFTEKSFKSSLGNYCDENGITLDIDYLFEILEANQIITSYGDVYYFRFSYWVYYFAAMQMHNDDDELKDFIITKKNYIHYPEILEFYTGKDRKRKDAVKFICDDLIISTQSVRQKVAWPEELNIFGLLKCQQTEEQKKKLIEDLDNNVKESNIPSELKDSFEDTCYSPSKPFNQSIKKFFDDYSISYLIQSIHIASQIFRNSDYVDRENKNELLGAILDSWKVFVQILCTIAKPLAIQRVVGYGDASFELVDYKENDTVENRLLKIIVAIPQNVMAYYKNDLYSDKNGKTILQSFEKETDRIKKHLLACVIVMERPQGWDKYISLYINQVGQNSYYLGNLKDIMLFVFNYYDMTKQEHNSLKMMIKRAVIKLETGNSNPTPRDFNRVSFVTEDEEGDETN